MGPVDWGAVGLDFLGLGVVEVVGSVLPLVEVVLAGAVWAREAEETPNLAAMSSFGSNAGAGGLGAASLVASLPSCFRGRLRSRSGVRSRYRDCVRTSSSAPSLAFFSFHLKPLDLLDLLDLGLLVVTGERERSREVDLSMMLVREFEL